MKPRILTVGRVHVETSMVLPYVPSSGHMVKGKDISRYPGGSAVNTAIALSKLGAESIISGRVGSDSNGKRVSGYLASKDVDVRYLEEDAIHPTGCLVRITEESGSSRGAFFDGANLKLSAQDIEFAYKSYPQGTLISADAPDEAIQAALAYGAREGVPTMLDARFDRAELLSLSRLQSVSVLLMDGELAEKYTGIEPGTVEKSLRCCIALSGMISARYYVLHLKDRGIFSYDGMYHRVVPTYDLPEGGCVATDAYFAAALFAKYIASGDMKASTEFAAVAEAAAKGRSGSAAALPSAEELRHFIEELKN